MGAAISGGVSAPADRNTSADIDKQLTREKDAFVATKKILLLGSGECGKSTVLKQMKIIHTEGFSEEELLSVVPVLHDNIISGISDAVAFCDSHAIPIQCDASASVFRDRRLAPVVLEPDVVRHVSALWADSGIQRAMLRAPEFHLPDQFSYYMQRLPFVAAPGYRPSTEDVLRARMRTTGVNELAFSVRLTHFRMIDVGGQRSERRKWLHHFQNVEALMYVSSLSDYNLTLWEDEQVNRLCEALELFGQLINGEFFRKMNIILFLNKRDLFEQKIQTIDLNTCFPEYRGGCHYESALLFVKQKFLELDRYPTRGIYSHVTTATDTSNVKFVFNAVIDIIIKQRLAQAALL